jgi:hypothetical protein
VNNETEVVSLKLVTPNAMKSDRTAVELLLNSDVYMLLTVGTCVTVTMRSRSHFAEKKWSNQRPAQ